MAEPDISPDIEYPSWYLKGVQEKNLTHFFIHVPVEFLKYSAGNEWFTVNISDTSFNEKEDPDALPEFNQDNIDRVIAIAAERLGIPDHERNRFRSLSYQEGLVNVISGDLFFGSNNLSNVKNINKVVEEVIELHSRSPKEVWEPVDVWREQVATETEEQRELEEATSRSGLSALAPTLGVEDLRTADIVSQRVVGGTQEVIINQSVDYLVYFWMQSNPEATVEDALASNELQRGLQDFINYANLLEQIRQTADEMFTQRTEIELLQSDDPEFNAVEIQTLQDAWDDNFALVNHLDEQVSDLQFTNSNNAWWLASIDIAAIPSMFETGGSLQDPFGNPDLFDVQAYDLAKMGVLSALEDEYFNGGGLTARTLEFIQEHVDENFDEWYDAYKSARLSASTTDTFGSLWILENHVADDIEEIIERQSSDVTFNEGVLADLFNRQFGNTSSWTGGKQLSYEFRSLMKEIVHKRFVDAWNDYSGSGDLSNRDLYPNKDDFWKTLSTEDFDRWINLELQGMVTNNYKEGRTFLEQLDAAGLSLVHLFKAAADPHFILEGSGGHDRFGNPVLNFNPTDEDAVLLDFFDALVAYSENPDNNFIALKGEADPESLAIVRFVNDNLGTVLDNLPDWLVHDVYGAVSDKLTVALEGQQLTEANADDIWNAITIDDETNPFNVYNTLAESVLTAVASFGLENQEALIEYLTSYSDADGNTGILNAFKALDIDWSLSNTLPGLGFQLSKLSEDDFPVPEPPELAPELAGILPPIIDYLPDVFRMDAIRFAESFLETEWGYQETIGKYDEEKRVSREEFIALEIFQSSLEAGIERYLESQFVNNPIVSLMIEYSGGLRDFFTAFPSFSELTPEQIINEIRKTIFNPPEGQEGHLSDALLNAEIQGFIEKGLLESAEFAEEYGAIYESDPDVLRWKAEEEREEKEEEFELEKEEREAEEEEREQERLREEEERERQLLAQIQIQGRSAAEIAFREQYQDILGAVVGPELAFQIQQDTVPGLQTEFLEMFEDFKGFLSPDEYVALTGEEFEPMATEWDAERGRLGEMQYNFFQQFDEDRILSLARQSQIARTRFDAPIARRQQRQLFTSPRTPQVPTGF